MLEPDDIPKFEKLPGEIFFRNKLLLPNASPIHSHPWGQINYVSEGVMIMDIEGVEYTSPPYHAVWVPAGMRHKGTMNTCGVYRSIYISGETEKKLPKFPCCLNISPLLRALLNELAAGNVDNPQTKAEVNMSKVVIDQIMKADILNMFLPEPSTLWLRKVLNDVQVNIYSRETSQQIAKKNHITLRTLERRCKSELDMSFGEWRQRIRYLKIIEDLRGNETIQQIAYNFGYSSPSAFITMFRRMSGQSPEQFRRTEFGSLKF